MRSVMASLKPQLELADKYDFQIAIENHRGALLNSVDSFKVSLDLANHPRIGIALAPYHLHYAWQYEKGVNQLPDFGSADFTPWLAALGRSNYAGWVNPFMHGENPPVEMAKALAKSKSCLAQCRAKT